MKKGIPNPNARPSGKYWHDPQDKAYAAVNGHAKRRPVVTERAAYRLMRDAVERAQS
jgi:hypothetical protein